MEFVAFALRSIRSANSIEYLQGAWETITQEVTSEFDLKMLRGEYDKKISSLQTVDTYEQDEVASMDNPIPNA